MAQALWLEVENAKFVRPNRHGPESGDITDRGLVALDAYRAERDKDAPKPAAKEPEPLSATELTAFRHFFHVDRTDMPDELAARLVALGLLWVVDESGDIKITDAGAACLEEAGHGPGGDEREPEFVRLKGHMPGLPVAKSAAELVLRIQYEECLRLARVQRSDWIWTEVGKREAELKALRGG